MLRTNPAAGGITYSESVGLQLAHPQARAWIELGLKQLAEIRRAHPTATESAILSTAGATLATYGGNANATVGYLSFIDAGQQIFVVGPMLQQLLEMTSLQDVDLADVRMPYAAFYVALPDTEYKVHHGDSGQHRLEGVYVTNWEIRGARYLHMVVWGAPHPGRPPWDDALFHFVFRMDGVLHDSIGELLSRIPADQGNNAVVAEYATKMVVALALYLSTPDAEKTVEPQYALSRPERRRLEGTPMSRVTNIARQVTVIAPAVERRATPALLAELRNPTRQHWVRGHWHRYWVGATTQRSLISKWIQPYKRGLGAAEVVQERVYSIKKN